MMRTDLSAQIFKTTTAPRGHVTTYFKIVAHVTTCYLLDEKVGSIIKCISCEHYATNAALTHLLPQEKRLNMGRGYGNF